MKKLLATLLGLTCAMALTVNAAEGEKAKPTPEQKAERKALIEKYDANKDGKVDKEERGKMSKEDKDKWASLGGGKKKGDIVANAPLPATRREEQKQNRRRKRERQRERGPEHELVEEHELVALD